MWQKTELLTQVRPGLVLNPGVQLALTFLQVPALELRDLIRREIENNPVLELGDENEEDRKPDPVEDSGKTGEHLLQEEETERRPAEADLDPPDLDSPDLDPALPREADGNDPGFPVPRGVLERREVRGPEEFGPGKARTLTDVLLPQLRLASRDSGLLRAGEYLIGCLDDRGYLACDPAEAAGALNVGSGVVLSALTLLQSLDPPGIGARDLRECLLLQLRARGREESVAWKILEEQFPLLCRGRRHSILRALRLTGDELRLGLDEIRSLYPHPGRLVAGEEVRYIYPDLILDRVGSGYEVRMNDGAVPDLRISRSYRELLAPTNSVAGKPGSSQGTRSAGSTGSAAKGGSSAEPYESACRFAEARLRSARWLIAAVERRRRTMLRVMECILEAQRDFFEKGPSHLKPLTLAQVAGQLGLHESTVARVLRSKYVQTPSGILPLKGFFSNRLPTAMGEETSGRAVRERIRNLIDEEDPTRPLTDDLIARKLSDSGVRIARRTVTKYRNSLRIEPAPLRRRRGGPARGTPPSPGRSCVFVHSKREESSNGDHHDQ